MAIKVSKYVVDDTNLPSVKLNLERHAALSVHPNIVTLRTGFAWKGHAIRILDYCSR
jgi:hypothetical protein